MAELRGFWEVWDAGKQLVFAPTLLAVSVALLAALTTAVVLLPPRRTLPRGRRDSRAGSAGRHRGHAPTGDWLEALGRVEMGLLLTEVATLLKAGAPPGRAWERALQRVGLGARSALNEEEIPQVFLDLEALPVPGWLPVYSEEERWRWRLPWPPASVKNERQVRSAIPGVIAACRLTHVLGAPLAGILEAVADGVGETAHAHDRRRAALAGPRSTARLLAALPPVGMFLSGAVGADPYALFLDGGIGTLCLLLGVGLMGLGWWLTARLTARAVAPEVGVDEALVLDLAGAALAAGASVPGVLRALSRAVGEVEFAVVGRALLYGAGWEEAWQAAEIIEESGSGILVNAGGESSTWRERHARLEGCLRPGWEDGASPELLLRATAAAIRAGRQADDEAAAEQLAIRLVVPLGLCHLPAFVLLCILPVVLSVGGGMLGI